MNLRKELTQLKEAGIIDDTTAARIEAYYAERDSSGSSLLYVFSVLGALLLGMGIILLFAHNWDMFPRMIKTMLAFLPLIIGQMACVFSLWKKPESKAWREGSATFLFFSVAAAISLVSQIYHTEGTVADLLFIWMLLSLPLLYIMQSGWVSLLLLVVNTWYIYTDFFGHNQQQEMYYVLIMLALIPFYKLLTKKHAQDYLTVLHHWFIPISLSLCLHLIGSKYSELITPAYFSMASAMVLSKDLKWFSVQNKWVNGYYWVGSWLMRILLIWVGFAYYWDDLLKFTPDFPAVLLSPEGLALFVFTATAVWLLYSQSKQGMWMEGDPMRFTFVAFLALFMVGSEMIGIQFWANMLVLGIAIKTIQQGIKEDHLGILNAGLLLLLALVISRFFDTKLSLLIRATMFMLVGAGFFVFNYLQLKKRKAGYAN